MKLTNTVLSAGFRKDSAQRFITEVSRKSGLCFESCFHCWCCSGGCPVIEAMDFKPNQLIRMMQYDLRREVLESRAIWLCIGCYNCVAQCPNRVHIPIMMETLREIALQEGGRISEPEIARFHQEFINQINRWGRVNDLDLIARYKLATHTLFQDMGAGMKMLIRGRLDLTLHKVREITGIKKIQSVCNETDP